MSELLPHTSSVVNELCVVRSMWTEAINHDPATTFIQTGSTLPGRPSMGAWAGYGLGSENADLPGFIVLNGGLIPPGGLDNFNSGLAGVAQEGIVHGTNDRSRSDPEEQDEGHK